MLITCKHIKSWFKPIQTNFKQIVFIAIACYAMFVLTLWLLPTTNSTFEARKDKLSIIRSPPRPLEPHPALSVEPSEKLTQRDTSTSKQENNDDDFHETIVIGLIACSGGWMEGKKINESVLAASEEPTTLLKSILISAKLGKAKNLEFHIYFDHRALAQVLENKISEFSKIFIDYFRITAQFHNVFHSVPYEYERDFVDNEKRCAFVRIFFHDSLPIDLKEILYLDTDVLITGNIVEMWKTLKNKIMHPLRAEKLALLSQNSEVYGTDYVDVYKYHFMPFPHVVPRGANTGVMFMNLEGMRQANWTEEMLKLYETWEYMLPNDQPLINIYFHDRLEKVEMLPCQWNFQHLHCEKALSCQNVSSDPGGIRIMHGAGEMFHIESRSHYRLYQAFKSFDLKNHQRVIPDLIYPLITSYNQAKNCKGAIGRFLFKQLLPK